MIKATSDESPFEIDSPIRICAANGMRKNYKKKNYLFRFKLSEKPKYELRIFGMAVLSWGSRSTIFGFGDKLKAKFVTQQVSKIHITVQ